jgi:hypothetical protein
MSEQLHSFASNYLYAVPAVMVIAWFWFVFEKSRIRHTAKNTILNNAFLIRNVVFIGAIAFLLILLNKPLPGLEESIIVSPADF